MNINALLSFIVSVFFALNSFSSDCHYIEIQDEDIFATCGEGQCCEIVFSDKADFHSLLRHVSRHHLSQYFDFVMQYEDTGDIGESRESSCINSVKLLAYLLLGEKQGRSCIKGLLHTSETTVCFNFSDGNHEHTIKRLFDGYVLQRMHEEHNVDFEAICPKQFKKFYNEYAAEEIGNYSKFICEVQLNLSELSSHKSADQMIKKYLPNSEYLFNEKVIEKLRCDICKNSFLVNESNSFVYFILILNASFVEHTFILMQSADSHQQTAAYRMYQSWKNKGTLKDGVKAAERAWDDAQIEDFLGMLQAFYCRADAASKPNYQPLFGYDVDSSQQIRFFPETDTVSGLSFRYLAYPVDPKTCVRNMKSVHLSMAERI